MKNVLFIVALLCLSISAIQETRGVVDQFKIVYGETHVSKPDPFGVTFNVRLDGNIAADKEPEGARVEHAVEATEGRYCASVQTQGVSGNAFAIYLTSQEPRDRATEQWDEIDFEFVGKDPTMVWTNLFHDGSDIGQGQAIPLGFNSDQVRARYCINWKVGDKAEFSINNQTIRVASLVGWVKPLHAVVSFWGVPQAGNQFFGFTGPQLLQPGASITSTASRILLQLGGQTGPAKIA